MIFGPDLLIVLIVILVLIGVPIWAILDASSRSSEAFHSAGSSKIAWIVAIAVLTLFFGPIGVVLAAIYLVWVRPRVKRATA